MFTISRYSEPTVKSCSFFFGFSIFSKQVITSHRFYRLSAVILSSYETRFVVNRGRHVRGSTILSLTVENDCLWYTLGVKLFMSRIIGTVPARARVLTSLLFSHSSCLLPSLSLSLSFSLSLPLDLRLCLSWALPLTYRPAPFPG